MRFLSATPVLFALAACYAYPSTPSASLTPQTTVRVFLNDVGRQSVLTQIGPNVDYVEGTVATADSGGVTIDARQVKRLTTPTEKYTTSRRVVLASKAIASATVPAISKKRSWLLGGVIAAGALLVGDAISGGEVFGLTGHRGDNNGK